MRKGRDEIVAAATVFAYLRATFAFCICGFFAAAPRLSPPPERLGVEQSVQVLA